MKRSSSDSNLFNFFRENNTANPLLDDQDSLDDKYISPPSKTPLITKNSDRQKEDKFEFELKSYYPLANQTKIEQKLSIEIQTAQDQVDQKYVKMDLRLHKIQDRLLSRWYLLLRQLQAPENRSFRKFLYKKLGIAGILSGVTVGSSLVIAKGVALINERSAAYKDFYVDKHSSLHNFYLVYSATCNDTVYQLPSPYLCTFYLPAHDGPVYNQSYKETIKKLCDPAARILCSNIDDDIKSWSITGIVLCVLVAVAIAVFCIKLIRNPRPGLAPVHDTNILPALPAEHKEVLIESGVVSPTVTEITTNGLLENIYQRRRQFTLFSTLKAQNLPPNINFIVAQYDEAIPLSCLPIAGDFAQGMGRGSGL